jgi:hypothetical protein
MERREGPGFAQDPPAHANSLVIRNSNARVFEGKWSPAEALHGFIDFHTDAWGDALRDVLIFGVISRPNWRPRAKI